MTVVLVIGCGNGSLIGVVADAPFRLSPPGTLPPPHLVADVIVSEHRMQQRVPLFSTCRAGVPSSRLTCLTQHALVCLQAAKAAKQGAVLAAGSACRWRTSACAATCASNSADPCSRSTVQTCTGSCSSHGNSGSAWSVWRDPSWCPVPMLQLQLWQLLFSKTFFAAASGVQCKMHAVFSSLCSCRVPSRA